MHVYYDYYYYSMGLTITIIGLAIWPDLPKMQSLNHAIKNLPTVYMAVLYEVELYKFFAYRKNH